MSCHQCHYYNQQYQFLHHAIKLTTIINSCSDVLFFFTYCDLDFSLQEVADKVFLYKYGRPKYMSIGSTISEFIFSSIYQTVFILQVRFFYSMQFLWCNNNFKQYFPVINVYINVPRCEWPQGQNDVHRSLGLGSVIWNQDFYLLQVKFKTKSLPTHFLILAKQLLF